MDALKLVPALAAALALTGCSASPPSEKSPVEFRAENGVASSAPGRTSSGTKLAACPLYGNKQELSIVLAVPTRFTLQSADGTGCSFGYDWQNIGVSGNAAKTLRQRMETYLKPYEDIGGDESVSDITYEPDVPAFGGRRGERLAHYCFCDGQEIESVDYRTAGVVVGESRSHLTKPFPKSVLPNVLRSVSVERGVFGIVAAHGTAVRYGVPTGVNYMSGLEDGVQFGFQKPEYHRVELRVGVRPLSGERDRLSRDNTVSKLVLTDASRAVAERAGQRLNYDQVFKDWDNSDRIEHVVVFQSGKVRVTVVNESGDDQQQTFRHRLRALS